MHSKSSFSAALAVGASLLSLSSAKPQGRAPGWAHSAALAGHPPPPTGWWASRPRPSQTSAAASTATSSAVVTPTSSVVIPSTHSGMNASTSSTTLSSVSSSATAGPTPAGYRYYNPNTAGYRIESLPDVDYDIGEMYSGLMPIVAGNTSRELFFVFEPTVGAPVDELTIWLNGGPGCSSLEAFFQENGRFTWQPGTYAPVQNDYAWANLTNMLFVEQPVGTGFSTGVVIATTEEEIAQDFVKFLKNFETTFGISNYSIYVTGESYAGRYVPYISAAILNEKDTTYYDLKGALVYDPCIGECTSVQEEVPVVPLVLNNQNLFGFNKSFIDQITTSYDSCGYKNWTDTYLTFPPPGHQPPFHVEDITDECDLFDLIYNTAFTPNPCFNVYSINWQCPQLWDVLGFPGSLAYAPGPIYFNRTDVKLAIHAPVDYNWEECASHNVFVNGTDSSALSIEHVLPQVIEATNRVLVSNGDFDMIVITNGTLLSIQNMTWGGLTGFQAKPTTPIDIPLPDLQYQALFAENGAAGLDGPQGIMGISHFERGLMWAETYSSGHMQPQFQPRVAYRHAQWLLGRIDAL